MVGAMRKLKHQELGITSGEGACCASSKEGQQDGDDEILEQGPRGKVHCGAPRAQHCR